MEGKVPSLMVHVLKLFPYTVIALVFFLTITAFFFSSKSDKRGSDRMDSKRRDFTQMEIIDQIHRKQLRKIQGWFIETGFGEFYKTRDMTPIKEYVEKRGYNFGVNPSVDKHTIYKGKQRHKLARILIQSKNIFNQLWCLAQVEHKGKIYEYWVIQEAARHKYNYRNCEFMISEAKSKEGKRKIIHSSSHFFSEHVISEDFTFDFPKEKVTKLRVYYYPECYQETEMEEVRKIVDGLE